MNRYELHAFADEQDLGKTIIDCPTDMAALGRAGRLAKRNGGPVDLARAGDDPWADRYITTAAPSEFHASGYCFERLT